MKDELEKAADVLNNGGIVIFPTDTAFAIGCRIDMPDAIKKVFNIRKRPESKASPVLVDGIAMAQKYLEFLDDRVTALMKKYWPGALTIVYPCKKETVPSFVRGGGKTLGVRMPNHKLVLDLIKRVGVPLLGSSANFHAEKTPYKLEDLDTDLVKLVDFVLEGDTNNLGNTSTVIDCSINPWKIIRQGAIEI